MDALVRRRLIALRSARGFTQKQVAEAIGWKQPTMSQYERGEFAANLDTLALFAAFYGVSLASLLATEGPAPPPPLAAPQAVNDWWVRLPDRKRKALVVLADAPAARPRASGAARRPASKRPRQRRSDPTEAPQRSD